MAINRASKFAVAQLVAKANSKTAWKFLEHLREVVPYKLHTIFTDTGIPLAQKPRNQDSVILRKMRFDLICEANGIERRLTKPNHARSNGQVERINRASRTPRFNGIAMTATIGFVVLLRISERPTIL